MTLCTVGPQANGVNSVIVDLGKGLVAQTYPKPEHSKAGESRQATSIA